MIKILKCLFSKKDKISNIAKDERLSLEGKYKMMMEAQTKRNIIAVNEIKNLLSGNNSLKVLCPAVKDDDVSIHSTSGLKYQLKKTGDEKDEGMPIFEIEKIERVFDTREGQKKVLVFDKR